MKAHRSLDSLDKEHLVHAIAAYKHRNQHCILFEWASGGNLRSYLNSTKGANPNPGVIRDCLEQLRGLTKALNTMHHTNEAGSRSESRSSIRSASSVGYSTLRSPGDSNTTAKHVRAAKVSGTSEELIKEPDASIPEITIDDEAYAEDQHSASVSESVSRLMRRQSREAENWRHGDIKPANILRFANGPPGLGTLKLADIGRARHHFKATINRPQREIDEWCPRPYEPPDLYIYDSENSISRLSDVWSLGCVFFELVVHILHGRDWLHDFEQTTKAATRNQTPFWVRDGNSARVTDTVQRCLNQMLEKDAECNEQQQSALRDLLILIQERMLVIEIPDDTEGFEEWKRANTNDILEELDNILEAAKDPNYLFTGNSRSNVKPLPTPELVAPSTKTQSGNSLSIPGVSSGQMRFDRSRNTYSGKLNSPWTRVQDDQFVRSVFKANTKEYNDCTFPDSEALCKFCSALCRNLDVLNAAPASRTVHELEAKCDLCMMLLARADLRGLSKATLITIRKEISDVALSAVEGSVTHSMRIRVCRSPGKLRQLVHKHKADCLCRRPASEESLRVIHTRWPSETSRAPQSSRLDSSACLAGRL